MAKPVQIKHTTCPMDCPDTCALQVQVTGDVITKISAADHHPTTGGFICSKVSRFARRVYHADRILHPMILDGPKGSGKFKQVSWDTALTLICDTYKIISSDHGAEAILPFHYGGSNGLLGDGMTDELFFARLGASRLARTLCAVPTSEVATGMYGKMPGVAFEDYVLAKFILIWGANPKTSNIHLVPFLKQAKKNGAFIAVIDPQNHFSSTEIDLHLPVLPGTDLVVALAMIRFWKDNGFIDFEFINQNSNHAEKLLDKSLKWSLESAEQISGVPAENIEKLARVYAETNPAVLRCGWGLERNRNGGQAIAAILAMPALLNKFGVHGGGYTLSNSNAFKLDKKSVLGDYSWNTRILNMTQLGSLLNGNLQPAIKGLFIYNCNPVATVPDQVKVIKGLSRNDLFTVYFDQVFSDTAHYADVLLPASTFLEQVEIKRSYGSYVLGGIQPVIDPLGECRANDEVFADLGRRMGFSDRIFYFDSKSLAQEILKNIRLNGENADADKILSGGNQTVQFDGESPLQFQNVFPETPDRKINFYPSVLGEYAYEFQPVSEKAFPLALISPASSKMTTSTLGEFNFPTLYAELNPVDALKRGISDGERIRVFNELGEVHCFAKINNSVRNGVLVIPKGAWRKSSLNGFTATALCASHVSNVGGGACYNDARVEVEPLKT